LALQWKGSKDIFSFQMSMWATQHCRMLHVEWAWLSAHKAINRFF